MNKRVKKNNAVAIPEVAWKHIKIECGKVARRFHLNDDDRADLESHVRCEVRIAMVTKFDPRRGKPYTFIQRVVKNQLCTWMEKETRRRNDFCSLAKAEALHAAQKARTLSGGLNDSVDDTSYPEEDRWDRGEIHPQKAENGDAAWDEEGYWRQKRMKDVREVVAQLEGVSRIICERFLLGYSLRLICKLMGCGSKHFFMDCWPACKRDFADAARRLGKHFEGEM